MLLIQKLMEDKKEMLDWNQHILLEYRLLKSENKVLNMKLLETKEEFYV